MKASQLRAGTEPGLVYLVRRGLDDFTLRLEYRLEGAAAQMGMALRFFHPEKPVPDRADPGRYREYADPSLVATHTGFEVQLGADRPGTEPGTFGGIVFGGATGAQLRAERAEVIPDEWNELEVAVRGDEYVVRLNGRESARFVNVDSYRGQHSTETAEAGLVGFVMRRGCMRVRRLELQADGLADGRGVHKECAEPAPPAAAIRHTPSARSNDATASGHGTGAAR